MISGPLSYRVFRETGPWCLYCRGTPLEGSSKHHRQEQPDCIVFFVIACNRAQNAGCLKLTIYSCFDWIERAIGILCKISSLHSRVLNRIHVFIGSGQIERWWMYWRLAAPSSLKQWYLHKLRPLASWIDQKTSLLPSMEVLQNQLALDHTLWFYNSSTFEPGLTNRLYCNFSLYFKTPISLIHWSILHDLRFKRNDAKSSTSFFVKNDHFRAGFSSLWKCNP